MKKTISLIFISATILMICFLVVISCSSIIEPLIDVFSYTEQPKIDYSEIIKNINMSRVLEHVRFLSSLGSRATGYPGNRIAAQYIYNQFVSIGLKNVTIQEFEVIDCIDHGTNITILSKGETLDLYSMLPNFVVPSTTPPEGISGHLVYVKDAELMDIDGLDINGSIALINWRAGSNWLTLYRLGAKAVIFLEPDPREFIPPLTHDVFSISSLATTTFIEDLPLKFPRFYAPKKVADYLLKNIGEKVVVRSSTYWDKVKTWNIIGFVEGTTWPDQSMMIITYYDSYSDAPRFAPGAQEAVSIASLLEIARYFQENKPKHTIIFVALGAHHQNLEGAAQFINGFLDPTRRWRTDRRLGWVIEKNIFWLINIQIDAGSDELLWVPGSSGGRSGSASTIFWQGFTDDGDITRYTTAYWLERFFKTTYSEIISSLGSSKYKAYYFSQYKISGVEEDVGTHFSWFTKTFDMEPFFLLRQGFSVFPSLSAFTTAYFNKFLFHPFDKYEYVNFRNIEPQLHIILCSLYKLANVDWTRDLLNDEAQTRILSWLTNKEANVANWRSILSAGGSVSWWGVNLTGIVGTWNESIGWYSPVPNALVIVEGGSGPQVGSNPKIFKNMPTSFRRITMADERGRFVFDGGFGTREYQYVTYIISAWVIDPLTGNIIYAPEMGRYRYRSNIIGWGMGIPNVGIVAVFNCSQIVVELYHPASLGSPTLPTGETLTPQLQLKNVKFEDLISYGVWNRHGLYVIAFPPNEWIKVIVHTVIERYPFAVYLNSTFEVPEGYGFALKPNEQIFIPVHQGISDLIIRTEYLSKLILGKEASAEDWQSFSNLLEAERLLKAALEALRNKQFSNYTVLCAESWRKAIDSYLYFRVKAESSAATIPFFSLLSIPFTILAEAVFFNLPGRRKILSITLIFSLLVAALYFLHPGFSLAASPTINIIGFSILLLLIPILIIMFRRIFDFLREVRVKSVGEHKVDIQRLGLSLIPCFRLAVENMKRRKLRSAIVLFSFILLVTSVSLFSSISAITILRSNEIAGVPLYNGILIRKDSWGEGGFDIGTRLLNFLEAKYGSSAVIAPRVWVYMFPRYRSQIDTYGTYGYKVRSIATGINVSVPIIWGLSSRENEVTNIAGLLVEGRWFNEIEDREMTPVCIITESIAREGKFKVGEIVDIAGTNFTIIGIIDDDIYYLRDLDREEISPIRFDVDPNPWDIHADPTYYVILPYRIVLRLNGRVASIAIKPFNPSLVPEIAKEIFSHVNVHQIYYVSDDRIWLFSASLSITAFGLEFQIVPIAIIILSLFNLLLASMYERRREIFIFNSLGLSPIHVALQFLAESITHAIVGSTIGYVSTLLIVKLIAPSLGIVLNPTSSHVTLIIGICMLSAIVASIYPVIMAARLATPSLERVWSPPTKPQGDVWEIPLPFVIKSDREATQLINFLKEFLIQHEYADAPIFTVSKYYSDEESNEWIIKRLNMEVALAPYDMGIRQEAAFILKRLFEERSWKTSIIMKRISGLSSAWERLSLKFVDEFRKQILIWRSMPENEKSSYDKK